MPALVRWGSASPTELQEHPILSSAHRRPARSRALTCLAVTAVSAGLLVPALAGTSTAARPAPALSVDLETTTTEALQEAMTAGRLTSKQLVAAYLERIADLNSDGPGLKAVRAINPDVYAEAVRADVERKQGNVRGPLHGIPVLLKDNIDVAGMPTTAGAYALKDSLPAGDAPVVTQLRAAGAVVLGKTNLSEFANFLTSGMPSGYSSLGGQVLNPYDTSVTPSGSSSGSGAAMAAGLGAATVGTETSGSILSPSAANSLVGVKPTVGLISRTGIIPISATQDTAGPMVRSVYDAAAMLSAMDGDDAEDPATAGGPSTTVDYTAALDDTALQGTRIGVVTMTNPDANYLAAQAVLREQGAELVPVAAPTASGGSILRYEFKRDLNAYLARLPERAPMKTLADVIAFNTANPTQTTKFGMSLLTSSQALDLSPTSADTATYTADRAAGLTSSRSSIDAVLTRGTTDTSDDLSAIVSPQSTTGVGARAGYPTVMVPNGYAAANRRPTPLSFLGTAYSEGTLLALAYDFEQAAKGYAWKPVSEINPTLYRCVEPKDAPADCAP